MGTDLGGVGMKRPVVCQERGEETLDVILGGVLACFPLAVDPVCGLIPQLCRYMAGLCCPAVIRS